MGLRARKRADSGVGMFSLVGGIREGGWRMGEMENERGPERLVKAELEAKS